MIILKMLGRLFSRNFGIYHVFMAVFLLLFIVYEMKLLYHKFQKGKRFAIYNTYVNEVNSLVDKLASSELRSSEQVKRLTKVLKISLKKNTTDDKR